MIQEKTLYRAAILTGRVVCALGIIIVAGWIVAGAEGRSVPLAGVGLALSFLGVSLWLQHRGEHQRAARAWAWAALVVTAVNLVPWWGGNPGRASLSPAALSGGFPNRVAGYLTLACAAAAVGLLALHKSPVRGLRSLHTWLALVVVAAAGGSFVAAEVITGGRQVDLVGPFSLLSVGAMTALVLLGAGLICARPRDQLPTMLFSATSAGVMGRRLLLGILITPLLVIGALLIPRGELGLSVPDSAFLLTVGYTLGGLAVILFAAQSATGLDELRVSAEQTRESLTAQLQNQAAQLQETVARRTQELREANAALQTVNQRLKLATEAAALGIWEWDATTQRSLWDNRTLQIYGLVEFDGTVEAWMRQIHPDDREKARAVFQGVLKGADSYELDCRILRPDGTVRFLESRAVVQRGPDGRLLRVIGTERDITSQIEASYQTLLLNDRLQLALRSSNFGVWEYEVGTNRIVWDDRMLEIYGIRREEFTGELQEWTRYVHPADASTPQAVIQNVLDGKAPSYDTSYRIVRADGSVRHIETHGYLQRDAEGQPLRLVGLNRDVTWEKTMQEAFQIAEQRWQLAIEGTNEAVWDWDIESGTIFHDEQWAEMLGYRPEEIDATLQGWRKLVHPDDLPACEAVTEEHLQQRVPLYQAEYRMLAQSGTWRWILDRGKVVKRQPDGQPLRMVGTHTDITARKDLEQRLRRTDELADQVSRLAHIGGWEIDLRAGRVTWSAEVCRIHEAEEGYQPSLDDVRGFFPPGIFETFEQGKPSPLAATFEHELPLVTAKGRHIWVRVLGRIESQADRPTRLHGALQDITSQHRSESDRRQLEVQLFQAQKMETLGTLSGGIAHDFNNLLTGIIGYHELAADSIPEDHPARACLAEAAHASRRARELVEQILTFSRQSAETEHGAVDLGLVVEEARRFLRATLPANVNIETEIDPTCSHVLADSTQIHQVILNLGSNAAHAMREHGGTLRLGLQPSEIDSDQAARLGGVTPGRYVCLSMSDTGHGMDELTMSRIFDPFFTTKNTREGTGLGLAVVHGIVRAHRGVIDLESKPGVGTTFRVYLPMSLDSSTGTAPEDEPTPLGSGELLCIVDDEGIVGRFTKATSEKLGYQAIAFSSAEECLASWQREPMNYRVLVTDQTMPGMQGTELAKAMRRSIPGLPVVIMSGYFSKISPRALDELGQVELLAKPFTTEQLAHAVHRALWSPRATEKIGHDPGI